MSINRDYFPSETAPFDGKQSLVVERLSPGNDIYKRILLFSLLTINPCYTYFK